ncbi:type II toxin-antitoxin system RelE/ParE family toxin [Acidocella sp.]|uniref:type II toxin-antitoxin system RelE family toxin n=1 Tax=Acidocella sp. TaxID=50710 RepID=UPI0026044E0B|nr:type II toxin-antitoxin system RelE/ParE family toxin [Acidocella sp.]
MPLVGFAFSEASLDFLESLPPKLRSQVMKKAKSLLENPYPQGAKKLNGIATAAGEPVYRERSGDYRILYVVRDKHREVVILDIDHRKDIYR